MAHHPSLQRPHQVHTAVAPQPRREHPFGGLRGCPQPRKPAEIGPVSRFPTEHRLQLVEGFHLLSPTLLREGHRHPELDASMVVVVVRQRKPRRGSGGHLTALLRLRSRTHPPASPFGSPAVASPGSGRVPINSCAKRSRQSRHQCYPASALSILIPAIPPWV